MAESIFKTFGPIQFDNVKVKGILEYKLKPWEVMFEVSTKITPNSSARSKFKSIAAFREWMVDNHIGRKPLTSQLESKLPEDWSVELWSGFGYCYDHSPHQLTYDNKSDFSFTLHIDAPDKPHWKDLEEGFRVVAHEIANLDTFKSNDFVEFRGEK